MKSHRLIWTFTALIVALALIVFSVRVGRDAMNNVATLQRDTAARDEAVARMLTLLEKDPRVRREVTRRVVEEAASFVDAPATASAEVHYASGLLLYYREYDVAEAEQAFRRTIALRPQWTWAHNALGIVLFASGRENEGMESFQEAMHIDPAWSRPYNDLAILYRRAGKMQGAIHAMERALELDPEGAITHYNFGVMLDIQGNAKSARKQYELVIALDDSLPAPFYNLACGYAREGDVEKALPYLATAIDLEPQFEEETTRDPDFDAVRDSAQFLEFMEETARRRAALTDDGQ